MVQGLVVGTIHTHNLHNLKRPSQHNLRLPNLQVVDVIKLMEKKVADISEQHLLKVVEVVAMM
jgi:hypothetical protein